VLNYKTFISKILNNKLLRNYKFKKKFIRICLFLFSILKNVKKLIFFGLYISKTKTLEYNNEIQFIVLMLIKQKLDLTE